MRLERVVFATLLALAPATGCMATSSREAEEASGDAAIVPTVFHAEAARALGTFEHDTRGDGPSGETSGEWSRLRVEYVPDGRAGGGLAVELARSDGDLLEGAGLTGGEGDARDLYLYLMGRFAPEPWLALPVRVGGYAHWLKVEQSPLDDETRWQSFGCRFEFEPEAWIFREPSIAVGVFADLSLGLHLSSIHSTTAGSSESYDGRGRTIGLGIGAQTLISERVLVRLGYLMRQSLEDESEELFGPAVPGVAATFRGVALEAGVRF